MYYFKSEPKENKWRNEFQKIQSQFIKELSEIPGYLKTLRNLNQAGIESERQKKLSEIRERFSEKKRELIFSRINYRKIDLELERTKIKFPENHSVIGDLQMNSALSFLSESKMQSEIFSLIDTLMELNKIDFLSFLTDGLLAKTQDSIKAIEFSDKLKSKVFPFYEKRGLKPIEQELHSIESATKDNEDFEKMFLSINQMEFTELSLHQKQIIKDFQPDVYTHLLENRKIVK